MNMRETTGENGSCKFSNYKFDYFHVENGGRCGVKVFASVFNLLASFAGVLNTDFAFERLHGSSAFARIVHRDSKLFYNERLSTNRLEHLGFISHASNTQFSVITFTNNIPDSICIS